MAIEIEIGGVPRRLPDRASARTRRDGRRVPAARTSHLQRKVARQGARTRARGGRPLPQAVPAESQLAASLDHPNIVPIYAAGEEGGPALSGDAVRRGLRPPRARGLDPGRPRARAGAPPAGAGRRRARRRARARARPPRRQAGERDRRRRTASSRTCATSGSPATRSSAESLTGHAGIRRHDRLPRAGADRVRRRRRAGRRLRARLRPLRVPGRQAAVRRARTTSSVIFAHVNEPPPLLTARALSCRRRSTRSSQKALAKEPDERYSTCSELVAEAPLRCRSAAPARRR